MLDLATYSRIVVKNLIRFVFETISCILALLIRPNRSRLPPIDDEILIKPAVRLGQDIATGRLTSERVVETFIRRIRQVNPIINAIVDENFDEALKTARQLDKQLETVRADGKLEEFLADKPFYGVPVTIKETIALKGNSFTAGLPSRAAVRATTTSPSVEKLIKSGAIPIGSTNVPCLCLWFDSSNNIYGRTNNPYDLSRVPGGSSGGEGAILAAAGSVIGVGSDLAGSIRIPAVFCGIFGHKPTPHTISNEGVYPKYTKEKEVMRGTGPMTRYAIDLKPMFKCMIDDAGEHAKRLRLDDPVDLRTTKVYFCEELGDLLASKCDSDILFGLRAAVQHLESTYDIKAQKVSLDEFRYGLAMWRAEFEGGHIYAPNHENGFTLVDPFQQLFKYFLASAEVPLTTIVHNLVEKLGAKVGSDKHTYLTKKAEQLRKRFLELVGDNGVLLMPTHPTSAPHHQTTVFKFANCSYTALGNTLHAPITQCPLGMSREGLPIGVQVIAGPYNDRLTLAIAVELDKAFGGWSPPSRVPNLTRP